MANENIEISQPNFCMGPQAGTICTVDTSNPQTVLRIKTTGGSTVIDLSMSSNILNTDVKVEYVGPSYLSSVVDDLTFFTFEKVSSTRCMIKRWQTRMAFREILLKEQVTKSTSGNERYNSNGFAVEYYYRHFTHPNEYYNYLNMDSVVNVKNGTRFFMGPSTDSDNPGATEVAVVSHVIDYIGGKRVYLTAPLKYQYVTGDLITFYSHIYIYSTEGYAGDASKGSLFKIDAYDWTVKGIDTKSIYKRVTASRWCPTVGGIASVVGTNALFVRPYDSYLNWKSMFLNNVDSDGNTTFPIYDLIFDNYSVYKLQKKITLRDDDGLRTTWNWGKYNFQEDSLLPYSSSVTTWVDQGIVTGYNKNVDVNVQVRDQFHVGLRDVYVNFYKEGDDGALFDPLSGAVTTDIDGTGVIDYRSGAAYNGHTEITTRATGGSTATGSQYLWTSNNIISFPDANPANTKLFTLKEVSGYLGTLKQILEWFKIWSVQKDDTGNWRWGWYEPFNYIKAKSFFTTPFGDWGDWRDGSFERPSSVLQWLPMLYRGEKQTDGPVQGAFTKGWPWYPSGNNWPIPNRITLIEESEGESRIHCLTDFFVYHKEGYDIIETPPQINIKQPDETGHGQISQLKLSLHTHWVDGDPYDSLWTYANIDQFVFVEDAIPKFWSEKNPVDTNIWIRLRPFAFSLDETTLRMWVRELSYIGDTGYYEVTDGISIDTFDAGSSMLGLEVTYDPPADFLHGSLIFVRIEVYDIAYLSNFVYTEYWFKITPDYKAPYIFNLSPDREEINVSTDSAVYFEIKDVGTGIDLSTLECLINSRRMQPEDLSIEVVSRYHVKVTYTPPQGLYYDKPYKITIKVTDTSPNENRMNDSYTFYTRPSTGVFITDPKPDFCKRGMERFEDVSAVVLADGNGIDLGTVRMQVFNKDVHPNIRPIVYRIS
jgi:hypothetical protein